MLLFTLNLFPTRKYHESYCHEYPQNSSQTLYYQLNIILEAFILPIELTKLWSSVLMLFQFVIPKLNNKL